MKTPEEINAELDAALAALEITPVLTKSERRAMVIGWFRIDGYFRRQSASKED